MRLLAFHSPDSAALGELEAKLLASGVFDHVERRGDSWVVAHSGGSLRARRDSVFFVEGAERLAGVTTSELGQRTLEGSLRALPGDFTFAWFRSPNEAHFVRSAVGTSPLFVWHGRAMLGVSSRLTDLARFMPEEPRLDPLALAVLSRLAFMPPAGRTPLASVELLASGSVLRWTKGGALKSTKWWVPPSRDSANVTFEDHAAELRRVVLDGLQRTLDASGKNLLALSGGFDSSVLASLTAGPLGLDFSTLTLVPPPGAALDWVSTRLARLRAEIGPHARRTWEREISPPRRMEYLRGAPVVVWTVAHPVLCLLPAIAEAEPLGCLFGGEGCDEHLGGGPALFDWASSAGPRSAALAYPKALPRTGAIRFWSSFRLRRTFRRAPLLSSLTPPSFLARATAAEYRDQARAEQAAFAKSRSDRPYLTHRVLHTGVATVQNWEVCSGLGIRRYFPFFNREVIELAYRCDPLELTNAEPKRLVRAAFRGVVPRHCSETPKHVWHDPAQDLDWGEPLPPELAGIVRDDWLERAPASVAAEDALRLRVLLNIISAIRTCRGVQRESRHVTRA